MGGTNQIPQKIKRRKKEIMKFGNLEKEIKFKGVIQKWKKQKEQKD